MGWNKRVKFWSQERLDLPDIVKLQNNVYDYLNKSNQKFIASLQYIVSGFITLDVGGLDIKVITKDSVALNTESTVEGLEGSLWIGSGDDTIDVDLTETLTNNAINYLEIEFYFENSAQDTRAFWDPTANANEGTTFQQIVDTCETVKVRLKVNTVAFTGNPNYIRISKVTTSGGSILDRKDERNLFYRSNSDYSWPNGRTVPSDTDFTGADKSISNQKESLDAIMTVIKELKGVEWYELLAAGISLRELLENENIIMSILSGEFDSTTGTLTWESDIKFMVPNQSFDFTILTGSLSGIADQDVVYVTFDRTGVAPVLSTQKIVNGSFTLHKDKWVIGYRRGDNFILRDGTVVQRIWAYEESTLVSSDIVPDEEIIIPLDSRDNSTIRNYRSGRAEVEFYINGIVQQRSQVLLTSTFDPNTYTSGTGVVTVPNGVDLSLIERGDYFRDVDNNEFTILGNINNNSGQKQFRIATAQVVNVNTGSVIFRQDYKDFGSDGDWVRKIIIRKFIPSGAILTFRMNPITKLGGGGGTSLQGAYSSGRFITILPGQPIEISGPPGQKLLRILGDLDVTGVIDPTAITFLPQGEDPAPGSNTLYLSDDGDMIFENQVTGETEFIGGGASSKNYGNVSGTDLPSGRAVRKNGADNVQLANWTDLITAGVIGITGVIIPDGGEKKVVKKSGLIKKDIFSTSSFVEGIFPSEGVWIYLGSSDGKMTVTPPPALSEKAQLIIGLWETDGLNLRIVPWGIA